MTRTKAQKREAARKFGSIDEEPAKPISYAEWVAQQNRYNAWMAQQKVQVASASGKRRGRRGSATCTNNLQHGTSSAAFTFIEVLFAVIILGIGLVALAELFAVGMVGTGAVMTDSRINGVLADAHQTISTQAASPGTSSLLPGQVNSKFMPIIVPLPPAFASRLGDQVLLSDNRYGWAAFYRRDSINNPFAQVFVIALRNDNFPLYAKPIPIPPSLYGAPPPTLPTIVGTLAFDPTSGTGTIAFASTVNNAAQGAFVLIADDGTNPQPTTWTDDKGIVHHGLIYNNAPLTGRFLKLGSQLATNLHLHFSLEPGHDLNATDWTSLTADGNSTGNVLVWMIGRAPMPNAAMGDFSGPFNGPNQDVGANSSFCAVNRNNN